MLHRIVILEPQLAEKIESQKRERDDPYSQINLPVEQSPVIGLVCDTEELEAKCYLDEAQDDLHAVQPRAGLTLHLLQKRREHRQNRERQGEGDGERQHSDHRGPELTLG